MGNTNDSESDTDKIAGFDAASNVTAISFATFLMDYPPSKSVFVKGIDERGGLAKTRRAKGQPTGWFLNTPDLTLFCRTCNGERVFRCLGHYKCEISYDDFVETCSWQDTVMPYTCSNCRNQTRHIAVGFEMEEAPNFKVYKYGEYPPFGPPTPNGLSKLLGRDRENFFQGRRSENQGLGIGAFAYYRRVVESKVDAIIDRIIEAAMKSNEAKSEVVQALVKAKTEVRFMDKLGSVKKAIPASILIDGKNPLEALHHTLSVGLHSDDDQECLRSAHDIRIVLGALAEKLDALLKSDSEVSEALHRILKGSRAGKAERQI